MDFRIVRRDITDWEWMSSPFHCNNLGTTHKSRGIGFVCERRTIFGWRKIVGRWTAKQPSRKHFVFNSQADAEVALKGWLVLKNEGGPKKVLDVVAEYEYTGPTAAERAIEALERVETKLLRRQ